MVWKPELDDLARRKAFAHEMGGVDKVKRQRDQGRLTVRERIDKLADKNSFHEIGAIAGIAQRHQKHTQPIALLRQFSGEGHDARDLCDRAQCRIDT